MHYLVAGQGKSGTTALFACLEQSLPGPLHTSFEPRDPAQIASVFDATGVVNTLSKVKLQYLDEKTVAVDRFDRIVLIVRDPRDMLVSRLLYGFYEFQQHGLVAEYDAACTVLQRKVDDPDSMGIYDVLVRLAELQGRKAAIGTKAQRRPVEFAQEHDPFVLRYEDFVDGELGALEAWLGLDLVREIDVGDRLRRVERSKSYGEWPEWFTDDDLVRCNRDWARYFEFFDYEPVTASKPDKYIPHETSIGYVQRFRPAHP